MERLNLAVSKTDQFNNLLRILFVALASLFISLMLSEKSYAADVEVQGIISGVPSADYWGLALAEKKIAGEWVEIETAYSKDLGVDGIYSLNLGESVGSEIRVTAFFQGPGRTYLARSPTFTVDTLIENQNFALGALNLKIQTSNTLACYSGYATATSDSLNFSRIGNQLSVKLLAGEASFSIPSDFSLSIIGRCHGNIEFETTATSTSSLQTIPISISTPNITGKISGITSSTDFYGVIQSKGIGEASAYWFDAPYSFAFNNSGQFALNLPTGTYRMVVKPSWEVLNESNYVTSYSNSFEVGSSAVALNFAITTRVNLIYTIQPTAIAKSGWVFIEKEIICGLKGIGYSESSDGKCYLYVDDGITVKSDGTVKLNVEAGSYRITASPNENTEGYVRTIGSAFTITDTETINNQTLTLDKANLKFNVSPKINAKFGQVNFEDSDGNWWGYSSSINDEGIAFVKVPAGTYRVKITPGTESPTAKTTFLTSLVVTGSEQIVNVTLSSGNVSGTVSSTAISAGSYVYVEEKIVSNKVYWREIYVSTSIDTNGRFSLALPSGTYRIWAAPNPDGKFIKTPSSQFTVAETDVEVNITLRTPNVTGTVTPFAKAANGYVYALNLDAWVEGYESSARVKDDGTFQMALPVGRYKFRAFPNGNFQNYFGITTEVLSVTDVPQSLELDLTLPNVTGTISPTIKSRGGWGYFEKLIDGSWQNIDWSSFNVNDQGKYSTYLPDGTYRIKIFPIASGVFNLTSDSLVVSGLDNGFDFTLPTTNLSIQINPINYSPGVDVVIEKFQNQGYFQYYDSARVNQNGLVEAYLPTGKYRLVLSPRGNKFGKTTSNIFDMPTSIEYPIPTTVTLLEANISGTISPKSESNWTQVCLEKIENEGVIYTDCQTTDSNGSYGFRSTPGTYRVVATPRSIIYGTRSDISSQYVITSSDEFELIEAPIVQNFSLSTGNLKGTINASDTSKSEGGWVQVLRTDGAYPMWTNYRTPISLSGKYSLQLPLGKYKLQIYPPENVSGVVRTESQDVTISSTTSIVSLDVALDVPNVVGTITPADKSAGGWVYAEQYVCDCGGNFWSQAQGIAAYGGIQRDGSYGLRVNNGLTRVVAYPNYSASGVTKTISSTFQATNEVQTKSFILSAGNVRGTISSTSNAAGGSVRAEIKNGEYWNWTNYYSNIAQDGTYRLQVEDGVYRLIATPGWQSVGVVETPSDEFEVTGGVTPSDIDFTLRAPNLSGTITNVPTSLDISRLSGADPKNFQVASAYILQKIGSGYFWINKWINIYADGSYSTYLPQGTYQIYVYQISSQVSGLSKTNTGDIIIGASNVDFDFDLTESNLKGTISPVAASKWGSVCAQKQNGLNWDWIVCDQVNEEGFYNFAVSPGEYRIVANPGWSSTGYSRIITEGSVTVASSGVSTLNATLQSSNVFLTIKDASGTPNYEGSISVNTVDGAYVDFGKGWISPLGKIDFYLQPGTYSIEISPGNNRIGVKTKTTLVITSSGSTTSTLTLAEGNVQGSVKDAAGTPVPCAFITATSADEVTQKTVSKSDGTFSLNLTQGKNWSISVVDPNSGGIGTGSLVVADSNLIEIDVP
jgi:hypothetical protein